LSAFGSAHDQSAVAFAVAAKEARLEHIAFLESTHTIVNPGFFADDYLVTIGSSAHLGIFPWIFGNSRNAPPSIEDIARIAVAALMDPARHAGKSYRPTGPELLGAEDMAKAAGRAVGRYVKVVPTPTWLFMKAARMVLFTGTVNDG
jgi:NAD(P)H dehydrogenase (quinone)